MVREVLTLNIGQAGIQLGQALWRQYNGEHSIDHSGKRITTNLDKYQLNDNSFEVFYEETNNGKFVPRNLSVDLEPNVIDDVKNSPLASMFHPQFLLAGDEDAANNWARGHYTVGKNMIDNVSDRLRKLVDKCSNIQGFIVNHSVGGGTGSGLGCLILERLAVDYRKKSKIGFEIYPSPNLSTCVVSPYNALFTTHWLLDHTEVSLLLDNEGIYSICQNQLSIETPSYDNLNRLISKVISSMTASLRFEGELNVDLNEFQTNLVPFPRLHFMISGIAPILPKSKQKTEKADVQSITDQCFQPNQWLVKIEDFDPKEDRYMAISLNYSGEIKSKEAGATIQWLKCNRKVEFVEWCPTGFKIGLNEHVATVIDGDDIASFQRNATMISNNVCLGRVFNERMGKKYDLMYNQRAFVHWYVGEGMEEGEFAEAREDLGFLEKDYLDVISEGDTDDVLEDEIDDDDDE